MSELSLEYFKNKIEFFTNELKKKEQGFDILFDTIKEFEFNEPSYPLANNGTKLITLGKEFIRLKYEVGIIKSIMKEFVERETAIQYLKKRIEFEVEGKKITENLIDNELSKDEYLFNLKTSYKTIETIFELIEDEIQMLIEAIQMIKKIADVKTVISVKLQKNFEYGS